MKISKLLTGNWKVKTHKNGKIVFSGSKGECIKFIAGFDRASTSYVDLRLIDKDGREFDYHKNEYTGK